MDGTHYDLYDIYFNCDQSYNPHNLYIKFKCNCVLSSYKLFIKVDKTAHISYYAKYIIHHIKQQSYIDLVILILILQKIKVKC